MASTPNRVVHAIKESGNIVGLSAVIATSVAILNPLPLLVGAVAEAAYLLFVPDSKWYSARLSRRHEAEIIKEREALKTQLLPQLEPDTQTRFRKLEEVRQQINSQDNTDKWFLDVVHKLDYLLEKFLVFSAKEIEFRRYLYGVWTDECGAMQSSGRRIPLNRLGADVPEPIPLPPATRVIQMGADIAASYVAQIEHLKGEAAKETDSNTKAIMQKRMEILQQRNEGVTKIGKIRTNLQYQIDLLEDTFGLINDQVRARSPEQVLNDIEGVVDQTESMTQLLEELAPYDQMAAA